MWGGTAGVSGGFEVVSRVCLKWWGVLVFIFIILSRVVVGFI